MTGRGLTRNNYEKWVRVTVVSLVTTYSLWKVSTNLIGICRPNQGIVDGGDLLITPSGSLANGCKGRVKSNHGFIRNGISLPHTRSFVNQNILVLSIGLDAIPITPRLK